MTIKIERLSIHPGKLKATDINEYVFQEKKIKFVQNPFRAQLNCKVILVIMLGLIFPRFDIFITDARAQMESTYSQPACREFLEPTNPAELKLLRECTKQQREARLKLRKGEIKVLRTASASFLSELLGGTPGEIMPTVNPDNIDASESSQ